MLTRVNRLLDRYFTSGGKIILGSCLFFAAGAMHLDSPVYLLLAAVVSLLLVAMLTSYFLRPELKCQTTLPDFFFVDEIGLLTLRVANEGSRAAREMEFFGLHNSKSKIAYQQTEHATAFIQSIEPGQHSNISLPFVGLKRGVSRCPVIRMRTAFPFNLVRSHQDFRSGQTVVVLPKYFPLRTASFLTGLSSDIVGDEGKSYAVADQEFVGSREYTPGISTRRWDYAAWARTAVPHVCQFDDEGYQRAILVFDPWQSAVDERRFDARVSLMLSIVSTLKDKSCEIDGCVIGSKRLVNDQLSEHQMAMQLAFELASVEPSTALELAEISVQQYKGQLYVFVLEKVQEDHIRLFDELNRRGCICLPITVGYENSSSEFKTVTVDEIESGEVSL